MMHRQSAAFRAAALAFVMAALVLGVVLFADGDTSSPEVQVEVEAPPGAASR